MRILTLTICTKESISHFPPLYGHRCTWNVTIPAPGCGTSNSCFVHVTCRSAFDHIYVRRMLRTRNNLCVAHVITCPRRCTVSLRLLPSAATDARQRYCDVLNNVTYWWLDRPLKALRSCQYIGFLEKINCNY